MELLFVLALSRHCFILCSKTKTGPKNCFVSKGTRLFKRRESEENALISNVTQRKPRYSEFKSQSFFSPPRTSQ